MNSPVFLSLMGPSLFVLTGCAAFGFGKRRRSATASPLDGKTAAAIGGGPRRTFRFRANGSRVKEALRDSEEKYRRAGGERQRRHLRCAGRRHQVLQSQAAADARLRPRAADDDAIHERHRGRGPAIGARSLRAAAARRGHSAPVRIPLSYRHGRVAVDRNQFGDDRLGGAARLAVLFSRRQRAEKDRASAARYPRPCIIRWSKACR